ncbi:hypothetical protein CONCODRAFT_70057 [Conidiobolus coronatus NRRL 28638]|uniref:Poly(A) RNA polymerase mitochondrial-like central palm domain-containing protein n=1 Tax=Conidiobolus coronatus (strain ATCC 28846 / CBS 209.66 / NRRL 28638) TaxID=796925 RepID=A0A137P828_CONC2|nr:hypothetical protein CONCODRAFT_70057 [Conidiobolus coronatus NRRL 28638]|eukprot:KXN71158.1 hypothetical protein CONCODRAFT_70057 [Conidiobolus coronatus NRRL 28638]
MTKKKPNTPNMSRKNSSGNEFNDRGKSSKFNKGSKKNFKKQKGGSKKDRIFNFNTGGSIGRDDEFSLNNSPFSNDDTLFQLPKGKNIKNSLLNDDDSDYGFGMGRSDRGDNSNNKRRKTNSNNNRKMSKGEAFNNSPRFGNSSQDSWSTKGRSTRESDNLENQPWITNPLAFINLSSSKSYFEEELSQLIEFLKPTERELIARAWVIEQVSMILEKMYDNSKCLPFGSFTTQLLLPGSDVDLVLLADSLKDKKALKSALYKMKDVIKRNGLLKPLTRVKVDICLNTITGLDSSKFTLQYSEEYPQLKWLTIIIKLLLDRLNLNDPAIGGMGGFELNQREHLNRVNIKNTQSCKKWIINSTDNFSSTINTNELSSTFDKLSSNKSEDSIQEFEFIVTSSDDEIEEAEQMEKAKQILNILSNPNLKTPKPIDLTDEKTLKKNEFWKSKGGVKRSHEVIDIDSD